MSQNDFSLANADGATFRSDNNGALQALASQSSGTAAPSTTYPFLLWADTTNSLLKMRDSGNTTWITVSSFSGGTLIPYRNTVAMAPSVIVAGTIVGTLATGTTFMPADDTIPTSSEGTEFMSFAYTPTNASSTLFIDVDSQLSSSVAVGSSGIISGALYIDSGTAAVSAASVFQDNGAASRRLSFTHRMSAGSTGARTFKFRAGIAAGTGALSFNGITGTRIFGGVSASGIKVTEVLP